MKPGKYDRQFQSHVQYGHCKIGERCFIGVNATLRDFLTIGDDCFISMDASITKDMQTGSIALGNPSEILNADNRKAVIIKKKYFNL